MSLTSKIRVGVLRGGPSSEYEVSLRTGAHVLKNLPDIYAPVDIFIDKRGVWHVSGLVEKPEKVFKKVDVLWNALHGEYGEDGGIQNLLETFGVPYTGSGRISSALAMQKLHAKNVLKRHGIKSPYHKIIKKSETTDESIGELFNTAANPSMVKPVSLGSSIGASVATSRSELKAAIDKAFSVAPTVLVEEFIQGKEATCGVVDVYRGDGAYTLLPAEIEPAPGSVFFDYATKYGGKSRVYHPGRFSAMEKDAIQNAARVAHRALGLRHYSRSDFIVHPRRGVYFLEANSLPGLYADAPFIESLVSVGLSFPDFLDHVLRLALGKE